MIGKVFPAYSEYKDSCIDWLGKIPKHWILKPLFTLMKERNERNIGNKEQNILSLSYGKIIRRTVDDNFGLIPASFETYQIVQDGNIIMRLTDLQNDKRSLRVGLVKELGIITSAYVCLEIIQELETSFAYSLLHSYDLTKIFYSLGGGVRQSMNYEDLKRLSILYPPLEEQKQIATFLDRATTEIDQIIEQQKQLITLLEEERTTVISHAVTQGLDTSVPMKDSGTILHPSIPEHWTLLRLGYLCNKVVDGPHFSPNYVDEPEGIMFLSARNVKTDKWSLDDAKFISEKDYLEFSKRVIPEIGDILYTKGGTTGIARVVDLEFRFQVWVHIAVLKIKKERVNPYFLSYVLNGDICYQQSQLYTSGATNNDLGLTRLTNIVLAIPSLKEQEQIISFLDQETARIDEAIKNVRSQIEKLEEYRTVLISDAVTGKIDVRKFNES